MHRLAVLLALAGCAVAPSGEAPGGTCTGKCDGDGPSSAAPLRGNLLANLIAQMDRPGVFFGQQRFDLTGVEPDGTQWLATPDALDRSDVASVTGRQPSVLGLDAWDLAMKPQTWAPSPAVHAAAARAVYAQGGIVTMDWHMRGCAETSSFKAAGNEACLCRLANDDDFARSWLIDGKLAHLADALVREGLDRIPIVFRPLHEHGGSWFWWGRPYWDCAAYVPDPAVTGEAAFQRVYRTIVTYLRDERGLDNLLFAYSPDRFGGANDEAAGDATRYLIGYPGDAFVDVLGIDLYYRSGTSFASQSTAFRTYLATVARVAYAHGKAAALTEVGDTQLATDSTPWFTEHLLPLLREAHIAYALTWENRRNAPTEFWVPFVGHRDVPDFQAFAADDATLFLDDLPDLYRPPTEGYPMCTSCASDPDGDGWGWEHETSCRIGSWCL